MTSRLSKNAVINSKNNISKQIRKNWSLYILLLIPMTYIIVFKYIPMYGTQIAFRNYQPVQGILGSPWVGLKHVRTFFNSYLFWRIFRNTIAISLYEMLTFPLPIILALLLNYIPSYWFKKTVQMVSYAPYYISTVVMVGMILQFLDMRNGLLNNILGLIGIDSINFMGNPQYFWHIYVWSGVWQGIGYSSIIYIAALSGVSPELHESAIIDGANIVKRIKYVDIPTILPTIIILLLLRCGSILSIGFEKIMLMQNTLNKPMSEVISTFVYKQGIASSMGNFSYATAVGLFVSIVNFILLITVNKAANALGENSLW